MKKISHIDVHGLSIPGESHQKNHDHFAIATLSKSMRLHQTNLTIDDDSRLHGHNQGQLLLVADGISGGPAPAQASGTAIDSVVQYFLNEMPWYHLADGAPEDVTLALEDALHNAQDELRKGAVAKSAGLGTTMTLAFVFWPDLYLAHVGDSRCYLQRNGRLQQLTTDHTLGQRASRGKKASLSSMHVLWNAIGGRRSTLHPEVRHLVLEPGDVLALLTDGVCDETSAMRLTSVLDTDAPADALCAELVQGRGCDDRTAVIARFLPHQEAQVGVAAHPTPPALDWRADSPGHPSVCTRSRHEAGRHGSRLVGPFSAVS